MGLTTQGRSEEREKRRNKNKERESGQDKAS
jgi:hypothetical protein